MKPVEVRQQAAEAHVAALRFRLDRDRFVNDMKPVVRALEELAATAWKKEPLERGRTFRMLGDALTDVGLATGAAPVRAAIGAYREATLLVERSGEGHLSGESFLCGLGLGTALQALSGRRLSREARGAYRRAAERRFWVDPAPVERALERMDRVWAATLPKGRWSIVAPPGTLGDARAYRADKVKLGPVLYPIVDLRRSIERTLRSKATHLNFAMKRGAHAPTTKIAFFIAPTPIREPVLISVSAPRSLAAGSPAVVRLAAYVRALEGEVEALLRSLSPRAEPRLGIESCLWKPGTRVRVRAAAQHMKFTPRERGFLWCGTRNLVEFEARVSNKAPLGFVPLRFEVLVAGLPLMSLSVDVEIASAPEARNVQRATAMATAVAPKTAFASYASKDRARVADRVSAASIATGMDIWLDCLSLHPNDRWKDAIAEQIRKRELFLLFWSSSARKSKWVTWEWSRALADKGLGAFQVHPLEPPSKAPPPKQLAALHFGDTRLLIR
jgi:hypothetical protein